MSNQPIKIGNYIERITRGHTCNGEVVEIDSINNRARIVWDQEAGDKKPRTWIRFADLLVIAECKPIRLMRSSANIGEWIATPNSTTYSHVRICSSEQMGEWHDYKKR
jgi:hypothetical protein